MLFCMFLFYNARVVPDILRCFSVRIKIAPAISQERKIGSHLHFILESTCSAKYECVNRRWQCS